MKLTSPTPLAVPALYATGVQQAMGHACRRGPLDEIKNTLDCRFT